MLDLLAVQQHREGREEMGALAMEEEGEEDTMEEEEDRLLLVACVVEEEDQDTLEDA